MLSKNRPFLKWAGGKYEVRDEIINLLPQANTLIEPFVGSGAIFLNSNNKKYILNDVNSDLIGLYKNLQKHKSRFINDAKKLFSKRNNSEKVYYRLRDKFNATRSKYEKSLIFLYLNRFGYNGLCRYNRGGEFNVPFGRYQSPYFPQSELEIFFQKSQNVSFRNDDFRKVIKSARRGQVIYCDPPYVPLSGTANFSSYSPGGFCADDQVDLAELALDASKRGVTILISNHDTPFTRRLYKGAKNKKIEVRRNISCKIDNRVKVKELLALYRP